MTDRLKKTWDEIDLVKKMAASAHKDQVDKAGAPYIDHVQRVAQNAMRYGHPFYLVGMLHDVVEDSSFGLGDIAALFDPEIVLAVDAITKRQGEDPMDYLERVASNDIAYLVKVYDMMDNANYSRYSKPGPQEFERCAGYLKRIATLMMLRQRHLNRTQGTSH